LGSIFAVVTPDECSVLWVQISGHPLEATFLFLIQSSVADPAVGNAILQRRHDFLLAPITSRLLGFLGPNVFTVCEIPDRIEPELLLLT
jgi:hypothetical protein